jgi:uncharacterized protein YegL
MEILVMSDLNSVLGGAKQDGLVTMAGIQAFQIVDLGDEIADNLGVTPDLVDSSEVFAFFGVVDDSGSIRFSGNTDAVKNGYNGILEALMKSKSRDEIIVGATLLNAGVLHPVSALKDAKRLDAHFNPEGGTPLYDRVIQTCELVVRKCKEFQDTGASFKGVIVIVTDGNDQGSRASAANVKAVLEPLLAKEIVSVVALGISDGSTDFKAVFASMGIPDNLVLTIDDDPSSIRKAFGVVSRATAAASQGASLSQSGLGGFGS